MKLSESLMVNIELSDETSFIEVVRYHGYIREVVTIFRGEQAQQIGQLLTTRANQFEQYALVDIMRTGIFNDPADWGDPVNNFDIHIDLSPFPCEESDCDVGIRTTKER